MKILILSCNTGEGHHSAALAIKEVLDKRGLENEITDPVSFAGDFASRKVADIYNSMIKRSPRTFGKFYRVGESYSNRFSRSPVYFANSLYAKRLLEYIKAQSFHRVICTHLYGMEAMTAIKRKLGVHIPCYGVLTDYTCIPFFCDTALDGYFIPHTALADEIAEKGIPREKLIATGIPVSERFLIKTDKNEARKIIGADVSKRMYLVMTGGVGCGNISEICDGIIKSEQGDFSVTVLAGKNENLLSELNARYRNDDRITAVGFTRDVPVYMKAADVLITKPGGLSSTEAAACEVPLVHLITIPGCETKNAEFFEALGMSVKSLSPCDAAKKAVALAKDVPVCEKMLAAQRAEINKNSSRDIVERVAEL